MGFENRLQLNDKQIRVRKIHTDHYRGINHSQIVFKTLGRGLTQICRTNPPFVLCGFTLRLCVFAIFISTKEISPQCSYIRSSVIISHHQSFISPQQSSAVLIVYSSSIFIVYSSSSSVLIISPHQSSSVLISPHQSSSVLTVLIQSSFSPHQYSSVLISPHQSSSVLISHHHHLSLICSLLN
jgi:hypothetical protein